jgi:hypothetical protein
MISEEEGCLKEKKTVKGIKKGVIKHHTKHEQYKQCTNFEKDWPTLFPDCFAWFSYRQALNTIV